MQKCRRDGCRPLFNRLSRVRQFPRNGDARKRTANHRKILRRLQAAAGAVRGPFVVNQAARRHQVGNALHHIVGYCAMHVAMLGPSRFVLRPESVHDESVAARAVAFGVSWGRQAKCRRPRQRQHVVCEVAGRVCAPLAAVARRRVSRIQRHDTEQRDDTDMMPGAPVMAHRDMRQPPARIDVKSKLLESLSQVSLSRMIACAGRFCVFTPMPGSFRTAVPTAKISTKLDPSSTM
jgi:hypothetical protein